MRTQEQIRAEQQARRDEWDRDAFARAALTGLLAHMTTHYDVQGFADRAYEYADAMMVARSAK